MIDLVSGSYPPVVLIPRSMVGKYNVDIRGWIRPGPEAFSGFGSDPDPDPSGSGRTRGYPDPDPNPSGPGLTRIFT